MIPARRSACLLLLAALAAGGCRREPPPHERVEVACVVVPETPAVGPATVRVTLTGPLGVPVPDARVRVEGNMSHPGMVPVFADLAARSPGRYEGKLEFTMAGDWFLIVTATLPDGRKVERQFDVPGVRTGGN